ncbi:hypothetical protein INT46_004089 [Mucor plumbeus]|uniref:BHLH domain-containing protein n=1 Tax=Mucor plumbeus TaxID=97098 RepID=A0A8H7V8A8_9FUNG|nr:hypothetical protein INT46_004089 [Mucor plumbeus]
MPPQYNNNAYNQQQLHYYHPSYPAYPAQQHYQHQTNADLVKSSPVSISSSNDNGSPRTPPTINNINNSNNIKHLIHVPQGTTTASSLMVNPLVPPPPAPPSSQQQFMLEATIKSTEERVKETIARANTIPMEFYQTEFFEYSKPLPQQQQINKKGKRSAIADEDEDKEQQAFSKKNKKRIENEDRLSNEEFRRQVHIQSEQKRRAQIKDGFEELKAHLPGCIHKKLSKAALLTRTVQQLEHMKKMQNELLDEVERLVKENSNLKKFAASATTTTTTTTTTRSL